MQRSETISNTELVLLTGDIIVLTYDAIVNPANENLQLGEGLQEHSK
jgi:O-acetyl-ADP-ribose deacetylase (regulator of RNase III)